MNQKLAKSNPETPLKVGLPGQINQDLRNRLTFHFGENEAAELAFQILEHVTGLTKTQILTENRPISIGQAFELENSVELLEKGHPLQYVIGKAWFCGLPLAIGQGALIPRPETEELVHWMLEEENQEAKTVLDLCTGSGCIALALRNLGNWHSVSGLDISAHALDYAKASSLLHGLSVNWILADLNSGWEPFQKLDIISANPPYILPSEANQMESHVLDFEPGIALFTPENDPIFFYSLIGNLAQQWLISGGKLYFELNPQTADQVVVMLQKAGFSDIETRLDMQGKKRMLKACLLNH